MIKEQFTNLLKHKNIIEQTRKDFIKSKPWSFFRRLTYIAMGIPTGWSMAHYYVLHFNGTWPKESLFGFGLHLINEFGGLTVVVGAGIAIYRAYLHRKDK